MKTALKNIVNGMVLSLGILLCYSVYFQQTNDTPLIELSIEDNSTTNFIDEDFEINEDDQVVYALNFILSLQKNQSHNHFYVVNNSNQSLFTVWQPPKLNSI